MVKISDNPNIDESATEPAIYYDALHHAREPASMTTTLYFMYWLLENYGTDPQATYLVDHREMFFVPVVNPDGYLYNEQTNPNGGGMWRKNRRNNGSCFGVDLNRNYSYGYGFNNGSSSNPCDDTYRGPNAFSEPETQAIRDLFAVIDPVIGFSTHTYAGRFLNPYGYIAEAPDYEVYSEFSSDFVSGSSYLYGITSEMLGYFSSGTTRDYLHSVGTYAWTPELGFDGFWPPPSSIVPIASENLPRFRYIAWVGGAFADFQNLRILTPGYVAGNDTISMTVGVKNRGLTQNAGNVIVTISTDYPYATPLITSAGYPSIPARQIVYNDTTPFKYFITGSAQALDEIDFIVTITGEGVETARDTIPVRVGVQTTLFADDAEGGTANWTGSGSGDMWDTTFVDFYDGLHSFADSRYGNSENNTASYLTTSGSIDLSGTLNPMLFYSTKWSIEEGYDYARIQISTNGGVSWTTMAGKYSTTVSGQPSYTGSRHWVHEEIDLSEYVGDQVKLRAYYDTDGGIPGDGFYFDNFRVVDLHPDDSSIPCGDITSFQYRCVNGTPYTLQFRLNFLNSVVHSGQQVTFDVDGTTYQTTIFDNGTHSRAQVVLSGQIAGTHTITLVDPSGCFPPGIVTCGTSALDGEWDAMDELWSPGTSLQSVEPITTSLAGNYPNPFNLSTTIRFSLAADSRVILKVYNSLGQEVATLLDGFERAGVRAVVWDGKNAAGAAVASGVYVVRLIAGQYVGTERIVLMK